MHVAMRVSSPPPVTTNKQTGATELLYSEAFGITDETYAYGSFHL